MFPKYRSLYLAFVCLALVSLTELATADLRGTVVDCDLDGAVELLDFAGFQSCVTGPDPEVEATGLCLCFDRDGDADVDLHDFGLFQASFTGAQFLDVYLTADIDDGTEVDKTTWLDNGIGGSDINRIGSNKRRSYDSAFRFHLPEAVQGESFVFARLALPLTASGADTLFPKLRIVGVAQDSPGEFSVTRPSLLPKTEAVVGWEFDERWPDNFDDESCLRLWRYTGDITSIVNEILARPGWGSGAAGKTLAIVVENDSGLDLGHSNFRDYFLPEKSDCDGPIAPRLELYRTIRSTFVGKEMLGRPTDHSVTVNAMSLIDVRAFIEYGTEPDIYRENTSPTLFEAGTPIEVELDGLTADTQYFYRMRYRLQGQTVFDAGPQRTFRTQRSADSTFVFTILTDSHLVGIIDTNNAERRDLYRTTMVNIIQDQPDFQIDVGDTLMNTFLDSVSGYSQEDVIALQLLQRPFFDMVAHSAPLYMVLGNHEQETGWLLDGSPGNLAIQSALARLTLFPNPAPNDFYTGDTNEPAFVGQRENYYAWEWGSALFVALDPYWYTTVKPHDRGQGAGSQDRWDWTLGFTQYNWLRSTLADSDATFKFVFSHQITGGTTDYGRGGIEAVRHALGGGGSYEWGGENLDGTWGFDTKRPGWATPIHEVLVENDVTIFFHGHDHVFVKQDLDGIVYQESPQPSVLYNSGHFEDGLYYNGDQVDNSGHLRVTVSPTEVTVDYVRAFLPGDGENRSVAYTYTIPAG